MGVLAAAGAISVGAVVTVLAVPVALSTITGAPGPAPTTLAAPEPPAPPQASGVPAELVRLYRAAAAAHCPRLPWTLLAAQGKVESGWRSDAVSPVGAVGIAQFMPATWARWGLDGDRDGRADPRNAADAIPAQARYDCMLLDATASLAAATSTPRIALTLAAYNAGPGAVTRHHGIPPYPETRAYVSAVLDTARQLAVG